MKRHLLLLVTSLVLLSSTASEAGNRGPRRQRIVSSKAHASPPLKRATPKTSLLQKTLQTRAAQGIKRHSRRIAKSPAVKKAARRAKVTLKRKSKRAALKLKRSPVTRAAGKALRLGADGAVAVYRGVVFATLFPFAWTLTKMAPLLLEMVVWAND